MKNKVLKCFALLFSCFCCLFAFTGCDNSRILKKVSKNLSAYDISAVLDEQTMTVSATETVSFINQTDVVLENVCFNFYPRAFRESSEVLPYTTKNMAKVFPNGIDYGDGTIENVKLNGKPISFSYVNESQTAICIDFEKPLEPKHKAEVEIKFSVKLANCTHRLGYFNGTVALGNFFPILAVYEKGEYVTNPYYSTGDPFFSDIANFKMKIEFPNKYKIASTGDILSSENKDKSKIYNISARAVRDFAIYLGENMKTVSKTVQKTQISYVGYNNDEDFEENLQTAVKSFMFYSQTFGKYPYKTLTVFKAPFVHGGMEYPNLVVISDSAVDKFDKAKVIAHEIAHQWWYGLVGNNQVKEAWLDESLAEYSSVLFFEAHSEYEASYKDMVSEAFSVYTLYADIVKSTAGTIKTSMLLPVNDYASEYEYSYMIYVKGVLMFDALRDIIGVKKIKKCFKKYFAEYEFKIATTDCLISCFRKASGRDIEGFFDSWLSGQTIVGTI